MFNTENPLSNVDLCNPAEVEQYFARLERQYPELVNAIKVIGIPYQQYLMTMRFLNQQPSVSSTSVPLSL